MEPSSTVQHLSTTADDKRVVAEHVLALRDGLVWNQIQGRSEKVATFELATAVVAEAGFAIDELGPHGLLRGARVYHSVVCSSRSSGEPGTIS